MLAARVSPPAEPRPRAASETRVRVQIPGGGCCSLSLPETQNFPYCSCVKYRFISPPLFYYPPRSSTGNAVQSATRPTSRQSRPFLFRTSPFPILPIFSFKNENEENWRKLPRRRRRSREKDKRAFRFFRRYGGNTIARSKVCLLRARRNKGRGKRRAVEITRIPFCRSTRSSIDIYAEYPIINRHTFSNYSSTCPN